MIQISFNYLEQIKIKEILLKEQKIPCKKEFTGQKHKLIE